MVLLRANLGRAIVTNGDFTAYVCDSAATRPSSQITLGKLVAVVVVIIVIVLVVDVGVVVTYNNHNRIIFIITDAITSV